MDRSTRITRVLEILSGATGPMGSVRIQGQMSRRHIALSEPTVGRLLREMDAQGLTLPVSRLGRIITSAGEAFLKRATEGYDRDKRVQRFAMSIRTSTKDEITDVLVARRAVEREIARAAAARATKAEIALLRSHAEAQSAGRTRVGLHDLLAQIAGNPVLESALHLIRGDLTIRARLNEILADQQKWHDEEFNRKIISALERHDPDAAEVAVMDHIESVLSAVEADWNGHGRSSGRRKQLPKAVPNV
jgi:GntR family transcriptional repressor for pyruvate dehydrogenase complex